MSGPCGVCSVLPDAHGAIPHPFVARTPAPTAVPVDRCTCGGDPKRRCPSCDAYPTPTADPVDLRDGTRPWDEARAPEIDALARILMDAWAKAEGPDNLVVRHPASYVATFADMARAVLALPAPTADPVDFCRKGVGTRPSWMGVDQYDSDRCRCILPTGHDEPCACEHTAPAPTADPVEVWVDVPDDAQPYTEAYPTADPVDLARMSIPDLIERATYPERRVYEQAEEIARLKDEWADTIDAMNVARAEVARLKSLDWVTIYDAQDEVRDLRAEVAAVRYDLGEALTERDAERAARETAEGRITALRLDTEKRAVEYERTLTRYGSAVEPGSRDEYTEGQLDGLRYALRALGVTP